MTPRPLIILIAGPYRSGTNGDPRLVAANLDRLESFAPPIYHAGHIPLIGEWVALPILKQAGKHLLESPNDKSVTDDELYAVAGRVLQRCDAVLRVDGASRGADQDVRIAQQYGLPVYHSIEEIPRLSGMQVKA